MHENKKRGRPPVEKAQDKRVQIKFDEDDLSEAKDSAKAEGYTFSGWVKVLIKKEIKRLKRKKSP